MMPFIRILASDWRVTAHGVVRFGDLQTDNWLMQVMRPACEPLNAAFRPRFHRKRLLSKWAAVPCFDRLLSGEYMPKSGYRVRYNLWKRLCRSLAVAFQGEMESAFAL